MEGWIKLHRDSLEHWVFKNAEDWKIWSFCLMNASHTFTQVMVKKKIFVKLMPGQMVFGRKQWASVLRMDEFKVYRTIKLFEECGMLSIFSTKQYSILTLCNWAFYQTEKPAQQHAQNSAQQTAQAETAENKPLREEEAQQESQEMHKDCTHNKNVKNEKKLKDKDTSKVFADGSPQYVLALDLRRRIKANDERTKVPDEDKLQKWAQEIDRMMRLDHRSEQEIRQVIEFSQDNSFWKCNILSAAKLREKFDTLKLQSKEQKAPKAANAKNVVPQIQNFTPRQYDDEFYEGLYENT